MSTACSICFTFSAVQAFNIPCTTDCSAHASRPNARCKAGSALRRWLISTSPPAPESRADKGIVELVARRVLDGFLRNLHRFSNRTKQVQALELHARRCQARTCSKLTFCEYARLDHDDRSPLSRV